METLRKHEMAFEGVHPHLAGPLAPNPNHHNTLSLAFDSTAMETRLGKYWPCELESIVKEPSEMKLIFALITGCKVIINRALTEEEREEKTINFTTPIDIEHLASLVGVDGPDIEVLNYVVRKAPDGVRSIIRALSREMKNTQLTEEI